MYSCHLFDVLYLFQVVADTAYVVHIVYVKLYLTFKNTVGGFNCQLADIDIQLARDDLRYLVQQSHTVDTFQINRHEE